MRYTQLGATGLKVSVLGFGCMRLPMVAENVDRELSTPLLRRAFDMGVNFFDTAIGYCNSDSQAAVGEALVGIRDKVVISTKNHLHSADPATWRAQLEHSLKMLRTDYIDLYHHHGIQWYTFETFLDPKKGGLTAQMIKAKEEGLIRHIGFSFHDTPQNLVKLIDTGYYENIIVQYNLLDQANSEAIAHAAQKGLGVVVMGPVGGGRLGLPNKSIVELTGAAAQSTPEAALRFVWGHTGVSVALSGMENIAMLEQNAALAAHAEPFTVKEIAALNDLVAQRKEKSGLYCSGCRYCTPSCPAGIDIPAQLDLLNNALIFGFEERSADQYRRDKVKARDCIACGGCLPKCPQRIDIPGKLRQAAQLFDEQFGGVLVESAVRSLKPTGDFSLALDLYNFSANPRDIALSLQGLHGEAFDQSALSIESLAPYARRKLRCNGQTGTAPAKLGFAAEINYEEACQRVRNEFSYAFITREFGEWTKVAATPEHFSADKASAALHGFAFRACYTDTELLLEVLVQDDFLFPSRRQEHKGKLVDGLELYLDGRRGARQGCAPYEEGVKQIMLYPGDPGRNPAFYHLSGECRLTVSSERTAQGYSMAVAIPFESFCVDKGVPERIGFDLGMNSANAQGERIGQVIWAGSGDNWENASGFCQFWLV